MWGERGACEALGGKSALDFYKETLRLQPTNTNAATHVAYDDVTEGGYVYVYTYARRICLWFMYNVQYQIGALYTSIFI